MILRADLPRGIQIAQAVHAAGESAPGVLPAGTFAVVLSVEGERELVHLADRLRLAGVDFVSIFEPDPPYDNALMAIGVRPGRKETLRRHLSSLPLLR